MRYFRKISTYSLGIFLLILLPYLASTADDNSQRLTSLKYALVFGEKLLGEGDYQKSTGQFEVALKLSQDLKIRSDEIYVLMQLGLLNWNLGRLEISSSFYKRALEMTRFSGLTSKKQKCDTALEIQRLYSKGKDSRASGQFDQSIKCFRQAIRLAKNINSPNHEVKCLRQMSLNYWEINDIEEYFKLNTQAQQLAHKIKNQKEEGICFNNIGLYYWKHTDYSKALKYFQLAFGIAEKKEESEIKSLSASNISLVYIDLGEYERALEYLLEVIKIDKEVKNEHYVSIDLNNLGIIYKNKGIMFDKKEEFQKAINIYNESLSIAKKILNKKVEGNVLNNIGEAFVSLKEYDNAMKYFNLGLKIAIESNDTELNSLILNNLGNSFFYSADYGKAIEYFSSAINLAIKINSGKILWEAYFGLGQCYERKGENLKAVQYYNRSIEIIDKIRSQIYLDTFKTGYVRNKAKVYESMINLIWKMNKGEDQESQEDRMFHFVEKAKARAFLECLVESKIDIQNNMNQTQREELNEASSRISSLYFELVKTGDIDQDSQNFKERLSQEEDNYMRLISKMRAEFPGMASLISPEPYSLEALPKYISDGQTVMVEYFLGDQRSFMIFIAKNSLDIFPIPPRHEIENSIKAYLKYLASPPQTEIDGKIAAKRIFKELLYPLEDQIYRGVEKLIIIPDGILYYLPFETLALTKTGQASAYLIDRYQVSYAPSASVLMFLNEKKENSGSYKGLLAFGDPVYQYQVPSDGGTTDSENILADIYMAQGFAFSPIPYSRDEIKAISKYFPKDQRSVYLGKEAREEVIKKGPHKNYQIIHFACHGLLDEQQPIRSALVLSQDLKNEDDGFLQVRELYNLRLSSNLVILSACQTGKGAMEKGEGILGLPRIFFYSGARSVLSTLWPINDKSTASFMKKFYAYLAKGISKAQALRLAKQEMIHSKYSHPYYWAGYVLNGESDSSVNFH
jgi:CHAT domain-containing protein/tetratricopeptide (TPR) repeat protein